MPKLGETWPLPTRRVRARPVLRVSSVASPEAVDTFETPDEPGSVDEMLRLRSELDELRLGATQRSRLFAALQSSSQAVMHELDTDGLMRSFARCVTQMAKADWTLLCTLDQDELLPGASYPERFAPMLFQEYRTFLEGALLRKRAHFCDLPPAAHDPLAVPYEMPQADGPGGRLLVVPVLDHRKQMIALILTRKAEEQPAFRQEEVRAIEILGLQFSTAFSRSKLFDRLSDWSKSLEMLLAFNAAINQHLPPSELVKRLVENAATFLKADGGNAGLAIPSGSTGELAMSCEAYFHQGAWHEFRRQWSRNEGVPGYVLENEFVYLSNNYPADPIADEELVARFGVHHVLCVPIKDVGGQLLGFFALHKGRRATPFTWQDAAFLESLGNSTAVAIQNAQLLKTLEVKSQEIRTLSAAHVRHLEEERRQIARELHDEAGQALIGIKLGLQVLARKVPSELSELGTELDRLRGLVNKSSTQLRDLARHLRPPTLDELGLEVAIRQLAMDHEQRGGVHITIAFEQLPGVIPDQVKTALYRIAQEALTNVARHAEARQVTMRMKAVETGLQFCVQDDGRGFEISDSGGGLGLLGMKERATMLGGQFTVRSAPGKGTEICVQMPL